jgi:ATP-dependent Lon protease
MTKKEKTFKNSAFSNIIEGDIEDLFDPSSDPSENKKDKQNLPELLPILTIKNTVLFPGVLIPITISRKSSQDLVKSLKGKKKFLGVLAQKNKETKDPEFPDLYEIGTVAKLIKVLHMPDSSGTTAIIQGVERFKIEEGVQEKPFLKARVKYLKEDNANLKNKEIKALSESVKETAISILQLNNNIPQEAQSAFEAIENPNFLVRFIASNMDLAVKSKQELLEINEFTERATILLKHMAHELQLLELKDEIHSKTHSDLDQQQRDYFLRQQMKTLQTELGEGTTQEIKELKLKSKDKKWSKEVKAFFDKQLEKLARTNSASPEYGTTYDHLDLMLNLPWNEFSKDNLDIAKAQKTLEKEHYGLEKVKERILEFLAVLKLKQDVQGSIICFSGAPGVGKTSLGKSIAKALDREYVRISLGGVRDEAEIRGHRKTYIGAMPGRIIRGLKKAKTANPVFILDEIDKVGADARGDVSSALLEVLDPEQNSNFADHYLEADFDLSKVMFIATANNLGNIHPALRDRMEIIQINGYTVEEKVQIAKKYLVPRQRKATGLKANQLSIDQKALQTLVEGYTLESGVRGLEKKIASLMRKTAKFVALDAEYEKRIKAKTIQDLLGSAPFSLDMYQNNDTAGVVTGLAWTSVGGDILFIESILSKGKGGLVLSGSLGDVMKESAKTTLSYVKAHYREYGIDYRLFQQYDLHIHVPAGAVPKDGPSAGVTLLTAIVSAFTQRKVKPNLAMTGEITLRGKVLPVGGLKEKMLAAKRAGIKEIILCERNRKDIEEIKQSYLEGLTFHYVRHMNEVIDLALLDEKVSNAIEFELKD